jgi:RND family efflux transporter MFP subunit
MHFSLKRVAIIGGIVFLALLMLYMTGVFKRGVIAPGRDVETSGQVYSDGDIIEVAREEVPQWYEAVGTVRPRTEARVSAQVNGRIVDVHVQPGQRVMTGDLLVRLDNREFQARLEQAEQGLAAARARKKQADQGLAGAKAVLAEAEASHERVKKYFGQQAATQQDLERARAVFQQARAGLEQAADGIAAANAAVEQAVQKVEEVTIALGYTVISAPVAGQIASRLADPGDMALAGRPLLVIQTAGHLRLEAAVREGLVNSIVVGQELKISIDALHKETTGTVEEIVPSGDPASRTFLIKVGLPPADGLYTGMFGRLFVPLAMRETILLPESAVSNIGQLEVVRLLQGKKQVAVFVKTGQRHGDRLEILSGLKEGDRVVVEATR